MDKLSGTKLSRMPDGATPPAKSPAKLFGWRLMTRNHQISRNGSRPACRHFPGAGRSQNL
jgi:hypothetical protein